MPLAEFEPSIPANRRPQTNALDYAATVIGVNFNAVKSIHQIHKMAQYTSRFTAVKFQVTAVL
jgi:hypothetical protein